MHNLNDLYKQQIMEHAKSPRNQGILAPADIDYHEINTTCGDELRVTIQLRGKTVANIQFIGAGCTISQSAASLMTEHIKGKKLDEVKKLTKDDILKILGITVAPGRIKCVTLILKTLHRGIHLYEQRNHAYH